MKTLGAEAAVWLETYLAWPGKEPLVLTDDQIRYLMRWFEVDDTGRRYRNTRGVYSRSKGAGKSPFAAMLASLEAFGPVIPDGLDANGDAVGKRRDAAEILIFATEETQTGNIYSPLCDLLINGEALTEYDLDVGFSRILSNDGAAIYPRSAAAASTDGRRTDFAVLDETHLMFNERLHELARIIRRNIAKRNGRSMEVTTAWRPGQRSVAELTWEYHQAVIEKRIPEQGLLFDMVSGPVPADWNNDDELVACLAVAYRGCDSWVDLERLVAEARDPTVDRADVERYFLNRLAVGDDQFIAPELWARCGGAARPPLGTSVCLGFDGAWTDDSTALIAVTMEGTAFVVGLWEKPPDQPLWEIDQREVDAVVHHAFRDFQVEMFYADPFRWQDWLASWQDSYGDRVRAWYTNRDRQMYEALVRLHDAVASVRLMHADDAGLTRHVGNAVKRPTKVGFTIQKPPGRLAKIDACVALTLAWEARADVMAKGWTKAVEARSKPRPTLISF